jgi:hypothetical protein
MADKLWVPPAGLPDVWLPPRPGRKGSADQSEWAKESFLRLVEHGYNYTQAAERLGYTYKWWATTRKRDPEWEALVLSATETTLTKWEYPDISRMPFHEFVERYAGFTLAEHQERIEAALMDPFGKIVLILGHPESGKSTLVSLWYVLYNICRNPDSRTAIVTKNGTKAQDLVLRIQRYLTEEGLYDEAPQNLIADFNGFKPDRSQGLEWSQDQFFVKHRQSGERDPTVQGLGIAKQIYGARLDYLILDDGLVMENQISPTTRERIDNWFDGEARSRAQQGQTIVNGTRLLPQDLYGQWRKAWRDHRLYREVIVPAILDEYTDNERPSWPEYWTLDGYDKTIEIDGEEHVVGFQMGLRDIREAITRKNPNRWRLIYQQENVEEEQAIFQQRHIDAAMELGAHRPLGRVFEHERLILGVDPATTGRAAAVLLAVDPTTRVRTVVDIFVGSALGATGVRNDLMYQFWDKYQDTPKIGLTVIEENFVKTLKGDEGLQERADSYGTLLQWPHTVGRGRGRSNKWDEEYGIAAMAGLFGTGLLAFANAGVDDAAKLLPLIEDLLTFPYSETQDAAIALWLANGWANEAQQSLPSQADMARRRGVPDVVRKRGRR